MIAAPFLRCGRAAWVRKNIEKMLVWKVRFSCSSVMSRDVLVGMLLAGIVDEDVDAAELGHHLLDRAIAEVLVAEIAGDGDRLAPLGLDDPLRLRRVVMLAQIEDGDVGALAREQGGDRAADAAVRAGDQRDLARQAGRSPDRTAPSPASARACSRDPGSSSSWIISTVSVSDIATCSTALIEAYNPVGRSAVPCDPCRMPAAVLSD